MFLMPWFSLDLSPPLCTLFNAHALNKCCRVPGRKHAPNKYYVPNSKVRLTTSVYGSSDFLLQFNKIFCCVESIASHIQSLLHTLLGTVCILGCRGAGFAGVQALCVEPLRGREECHCPQPQL